MSQKKKVKRKIFLFNHLFNEKNESEKIDGYALTRKLKLSQIKRIKLHSGQGDYI